MENVDKDLVFLRKEFKRAVKRSENAVLGLMSELEIKMENPKLKVLKMEAANLLVSPLLLEEDDN